MPHRRCSLPVADWPEPDRTAWAAATSRADPLDDPGAAAHWRPKTRSTVATRYGLWLAWLREAGLLDPRATPASRVTRANLGAYLDALRLGHRASVTIAGRIRDLREAVRVMQPDADLSVLTHVLVRVEAVAEPSRPKRLHVVSPALLLGTAINEMSRLHAAQQQQPSRWTAERYRDALMIAFLATRPVRLANLTTIELTRHLTREGPSYWCRFRADEIKDGVPLAFSLPASLTVWLDHYLSVHRPLLLRGRPSSRLWISIRSTPLADNSVYCRVCHLTARLFGHPINPHLFRDCAATFIAEQAPEQVRIIAQILGHSTLRTSEEQYNHAGMLSAHRRYADALDRLLAATPASASAPQALAVDAGE
jgi:integrase/recombinase XerD